MEVSRPSNIALIKYMGKIPQVDPSQKNIPTNSSFSWTLESLRTFVVAEPSKNIETDQWAPLTGSRFQNFVMSEKGQRRYLEFWKFLKNHFSLSENYKIFSGNNFPADCGLASSASSFAALTEAAYQTAKQKNPDIIKTPAELGDLSRLGSGSSCRSFFSPWCRWDASGVTPVELPYKKLNHYVLVISEDKKAVSSSDAHVRVATSSLFEGRPQRANLRLEMLLESFRRGQWDQAFEHTWTEFIEMHELFHTSKPGFTYFNKDVKKVLESLSDSRKLKKDSPLVTMDAGPNIHLLFNEDQKKLEASLIGDLKRDVKCISSEELDGL